MQYVLQHDAYVIQCIIEVFFAELHAFNRPGPAGKFPSGRRLGKVILSVIRVLGLLRNLGLALINTALLIGNSSCA